MEKRQSRDMNCTGTLNKVKKPPEGRQKFLILTPKGRGGKSMSGAYPLSRRRRLKKNINVFIRIECEMVKASEKQQEFHTLHISLYFLFSESTVGSCSAA